MQWLLDALKDEPIVAAILILAIIGFVLSIKNGILLVKKEKTEKQKAQHKSIKKYLGLISGAVAVCFLLYNYVSPYINEQIERYHENIRLEYKLELGTQYKLLEENATKIGKWRSIQGSEYIGFYGATYVSIYKKDDVYSMVLYSKEGEIIEMRQSENNEGDFISFPPLFFSKESQELFRSFGTLREICERIN